MDFEYWRHYARGWLLHFFGREQPAFIEFEAAYRQKPSVDAARHLAFLAARGKHFDISDRWYREVLRLAPDDAESWFNLGFIRQESGKSREAIEAFGETVRLKPALDRAWYGLGLAHARLGEHQDAAAAFAKAAELQPMNGEAYYQLGMAWHHANAPEQVTDTVKRLVEFDPQRARKLVHDAQRTDLRHLIPNMPF